MKNLFLTFALTVICYCALAQTNAFPSSGNAGVGTTTPGYQLELRNGSGEAIIASNAKLLFGDIVTSMNLRMDNSGNLQITNSGLSPIVSFLQSGNVGIGVTGPSAKLHIFSSFDAATTSTFKMFYSGSWGTASYASAYRFIDCASTEGGNILEANGYGVGIGGYDPPGYLSPDKLYVNGNVGIGTNNPQGYKLAVNGSAIATSMIVKLNANWPDFVFKPTYNLPSLAEVKTYIDNNQRLPEMPSEKDVVKDGLNLGDINRLLVKKVEELTLYLIDKDKKDQKQEERIQKLEAVVETIAGK